MCMQRAAIDGEGCSQEWKAPVSPVTRRLAREPFGRVETLEVSRLNSVLCQAFSRAQLTSQRTQCVAALPALDFGFTFWRNV